MFGRIPSHCALSAAVLAAVMFPGCQSAPLAQDEPPLPYPSVQGRPRSIVFDAPSLRGFSAASTAAREAGDVPWYAWRNDVRPVALAGYRSATIDQFVNITYDRQSISGGRSRDYYSSVTYRQTATDTVR